MCALLQFTQSISNWEQMSIQATRLSTLCCWGRIRILFITDSSNYQIVNLCIMKVDSEFLEWSTWRDHESIIVLVFVNTKEVALFIRQEQLVISHCGWGRFNLLAKFMTLRHQSKLQPLEPAGFQICAVCSFIYRSKICSRINCK